MTLTTFRALWQRFHPSSWPLGRSFAEYQGENVTRFHLLPLGRPHVLNRDELKMLLKRFNLLADAVLGDGATVWLVFAEWSKPDVQPDLKTRNRIRRFKSRYRLTSDWDFFSPADRQTYTIFAAETVWRSQAFDRLLIDMHHLRMQDVLFLKPYDGTVFRPYAVGADVAMPSPAALVDLIGQFPGWLPTHGRGFVRFNKAQMAGQGGKFTVPKSVAEAIHKAVTPEAS